MYFDVIFGEGERNRIQIHSVRTRLKGRKRHGLGEFNFVFIRLYLLPQLLTKGKIIIHIGKNFLINYCMYVYILCSVPCAVKIDGRYAGNASYNYKILETDGNCLLEFLPSSPYYAPLSYFIGEKPKTTENVKIIDLYGGYLMIPAFRRTVFSDFKLIGRKTFDVGGGRVAVTCYAENGIRLIVERGEYMAAESLPFLPENVNFERINDCLLIALTGKKNLLSAYSFKRGIEKAFTRSCDNFRIDGDKLITTEIKNDFVGHIITVKWSFSKGVTAVSSKIERKKSLYALPPNCLKYAFFEEFIVGGDVGEYLSPTLKPRAKELSQFLGKFKAVLPPPHFKDENCVLLLYDDNVQYAKIQTSGGLITNVTTFDKD